MPKKKEKPAKGIVVSKTPSESKALPNPNIKVIKPTSPEIPEPLKPFATHIGTGKSCTGKLYCCPPVIPKEAAQKSFLGIFRDLLKIVNRG